MSLDKVAILCPAFGGIEPQAVEYMIATACSAWKHGIEVDQVGFVDKMLIDTARNVLAQGFLKTDCEWAFWVDSDMILPPATIYTLLNIAKEKNAKFVTGIYYQRQGEHLAVLWKKDPVDFEDNPVPYPPKKDKNNAYRHHAIIPEPGNKKPFKADVCGFGCVLTHREMFEKIKYPWFKMIADECSEDFYFCVKAKEAGFQLWTAPELRIGHIGRPEVFFAEHIKVDKSQLKPVKMEA